MAKPRLGFMFDFKMKILRIFVKGWLAFIN